MVKESSFWSNKTSKNSSEQKVSTFSTTQKVEVVLGNDEILFIPAPSSKKRNLQHVYEITKRLAKGRGIYVEAIRKLSKVEAKTMNKTAEYDDISFVIENNIKLMGKTTVIIDDTYGEGKTLRAMIKLLRKNKVKNIYYMSLCKNTNGGIKYVK